MEVQSEIYSETDYKSVLVQTGNVISKFKFDLPKLQTEQLNDLKEDKDSDLLVVRKKNECIEIEHKKSTILSEVGLQVWRGAFLINDFILSNHDMFSNKIVLELGSGVALTSILASIFSKRVLCTDINIGGILELIKRNIELNKQYQKTPNNVAVYELNFMAKQWSVDLEEELKNVDIVLAADVIYDDDISEALIKTILRIFNLSPKLRNMWMALEKRYVFTDSCCAPMYDHFLKQFRQAISGTTLRFSEQPTNFPQYFEYDRCKELVLLQISRN
ncbi:unnamed protein product [Diamesa serratosioi]